MIYFIFLASLASATCYLAYYWRNMTAFRLRKQLVNLSTCSLVYLPCYSVFYLPCLQATCSLVYSFTCPLTLLLCLSSQATCLLVYSFTHLLITLPHTPRIGSIFSASLRRIIVFFSANTWHYSKKVVSLLH